LEVNPVYADATRWVELHGIKLVKREQRLVAYIPTPCSQYQPDGCAIYDTRPDVCRNWPTSQADIDDLHDYTGEEVCTVTIGKG